VAPHETPLDVHQHKQIVQADYDARTDEWRTIYDGTSFHDHLIKERLRRTLALLDRGPHAAGEALDGGCGGGQLVAALAERGYTTSGFDISQGMVDTTQALLASKGLHADVRTASADALPYETGRFAVVTGLGLIEYLPDPRAAVRELARVVAPGGRLVVTAPNPLRLGYVADPIGAVMGLVRKPEHGYRRHYLTGKQLRRAVEDVGLRVDELQGHGLGRFSIAGRPLQSEEQAIRLSDRLEQRLPRRLVDVLGSNLIVLATKPR
jgi:2-polyprenyl-3-methyl-5-hydroxy-6-metoxy-1,4-benzoquinol methylase